MQNDSMLSKQEKIGFMNHLFTNQTNIYDTTTDEKYFGIDSIYDIASKILHGSIQWSKSIPFFPDLSVGFLIIGSLTL